MDDNYHQQWHQENSGWPQDLDKLIRIGTSMSSEMEASFTLFLHENVDVFTWKPSNMPGIPSKIVEHCLNKKLRQSRCSNASTALMRKGGRQSVRSSVDSWPLASSRKYNILIGWPILSWSRRRMGSGECASTTWASTRLLRKIVPSHSECPGGWFHDRLWGPLLPRCVL
jgi:hypothetical protein